MNRASKLGQRLKERSRRLAKRAVVEVARLAHAPPIAETPITRALSWARTRELPTGGLPVHSEHPHGYAEVSGYWVPTLLAYGEKPLAVRLLRWLLCAQRASGAFTDPDGAQPFVFDTGQVLRGLLAGQKWLPSAQLSARRAADFLCAAAVDGGRGGFGRPHGDEVPETVHLYVLPALMEAARLFQNDRYRAVAERCLAYFLDHPQLLDLKGLTHFLAYELEALLDLGQEARARPVLEQLAREQRADGGLRGRGGVDWICTPGLAQAAICWYRVGLWSAADRALAWLERRQQPSGGFLGSHGRGANYFPREEIAWAAKFYLDAHLQRVRSFMGRLVGEFPSELAATDGRAQAVLELVRPWHEVIEVGCGKGRFLKLIRAEQPEAHCSGVDISPVLLAQVPPGIRCLEGSLENTPGLDESYDVVFSVEAVEHSSNWAAAVAEMARITKPGGWILIIDKERRHWGRFACPPWERWPANEEMLRLLGRHCDQVSATPVTYDRHPADGLMMAWRGRKRSRLTGREWNRLLAGPDEKAAVVNRVRHNQFSPWGRELIGLTLPGERVLEIGSGTGEISLALAQAGRQVTMLDISQESLDFAAACAEELGVQARGAQGDAQQPLPFRDGEFDVVWSSGLLEHFTPAERQAMLREWLRVTSGRIVSLVPNAASLAYRVGKALQEESDAWPYGLETPILSLREDYSAVGMRTVAEYSVGAWHALNFLPGDHLLRQALSVWMRGQSEGMLQDCHQGYLLVSVGARAQESGRVAGAPPRGR